MARVLIVEDEVALQEAYRFILEADGHKVTSAFDGKAGLKLALKHRYDLILLDIHMPLMNGWEFLKKYRSETHSMTKVIVFSNMIEPNFVEQAKQLGAARSVLKSSMTPSGMLKLISEYSDIPTKH